MRIAFFLLGLVALLSIVLAIALWTGFSRADSRPALSPAQVVKKKYPDAELHGTTWADSEQPAVIATIDGYRGYFIFRWIEGEWRIVYSALD